MRISFDGSLRDFICRYIIKNKKEPILEELIEEATKLHMEEINKLQGIIRENNKEIKYLKENK